jgi:hypothetical protein
MARFSGEKNIIEHKNVSLDFVYNFKTFLIIRRIERGIIIT